VDIVENPIVVDTIDSLEVFTKLRENWNDVYALDKDASYFLSWKWLSQLYAIRDEGVFILAVKLSANSNEYCAFFPLRQEVRFSQSRQRFFNSYCMAGNYWADNTGLICDPESDHIAIPQLAYALKSLSWHRILFENLKLSPQRISLLMEPFSSEQYAIRQKSLTDNHGKTDLSRSPVVELPGTFEQYLQKSINANTRQKIRRVQRKINDDPELTIELATSNCIERYLAFFERVWISNWEHLKGSNTRQLAQKYSAFIRSGIRSGDMIVPILLHKANPVGMLACYSDPLKKQLLFFVAGRDAEFNFIPGGLALHAFCIQWSIDNGYKRYDLLRGNEPYKYSLGANDSLLSNTIMYKRSPPVSAQLLNDGLVKQPVARELAWQYRRALSVC